ncbi:site-specific integrase [Chloroflexi bacterium CFX6]|nr:site-specific integrase [Chloroflexi bacterium CFX6]
MIHRQNWLDVRAYLHHIERVRQNDPQTVKRARGHLRHLLEWADETPFAKSRNIDPTFPAYLLAVRKSPSLFSTENGEGLGVGQGVGLSPASITKCLANARQFFDFARSEWTLRYKPISASWIELLQPPRSVRQDSRLPVRQFWQLDDVMKVSAVATETLREERGKVAVCILFLSGMRADALASLPISCVDLADRTIYQLPERGVRTKNRKAAKTYLLQIPDLLTVVNRWNDLLSASRLPPSALWYSTLSRDGMTLTPTAHAFEGRHNIIAEDVRLICEKTGIPYLSPHKLRHGHTVYALKRASNVAQLKAISQNIMHASLVTTDQIYGKLINDDVQEIISSL